MFQEVLFLLCTLSGLSSFPTHELEKKKEEKERGQSYNGEEEENHNTKLEDSTKECEEKLKDEIGNTKEEEEGQKHQATLPSNILSSGTVSIQHCFQCFASAAMVSCRPRFPANNFYLGWRIIHLEDTACDLHITFRYCFFRYMWR